ncbi:MAG: HEAT repeat domain-containing protein [Candidatus Wallbacteria bacterium]|nr:HEAT repeat domain-containing protein [Candidatus Wallbacteria bacterium]
MNNLRETVIEGISKEPLETVENTLMRVYNHLQLEQRYIMVRELITLFSAEKWLERKKASIILASIGKDAVNPMLKALQTEENRDTLYWLMHTLMAVGGPEVLAVFEHLLDHPSHQLRAYVIQNLEHLKHPAKLSLLIKALNDPIWQHRKTASEIINGLGMSAVKQLNTLYKNATQDQRFWIIKSIGTILREKGVDPFCKFVIKGDKEARYFALVALAATREEHAIPIFIKSLRDKEWYLRFQAANYLEGFGEKAVPHLMQYAQREKNCSARLTAYKVIARIQKGESVPFFRGLLKSGSRDKFEEEKIIIMEALGETGSRAAVELLIDMFEDDKWLVRKEAVRMISRIGNRIPEEVLPVFRGYFDSEMENPCYWILQVVEESSSVFHEIYHYYFKIRNDNIRNAIVQSVCTLSPDRFDDDILAVLFAGLSDPFWPVRKMSAEAIAGVGMRVVQPLLNLAATRIDRNTCHWVQQILQHIVPEGVRALTNFLREKGISDLSELCINQNGDTSLRQGSSCLPSSAETGINTQPADKPPVQAPSDFIDTTQVNITYTDRQVKQFLEELKHSEFEEVKFMSLQSLCSIRSLDDSHNEKIRKVFDRLRQKASEELKRAIDEAASKIFSTD